MIEFRILNEHPLFDYRESCKITQGELIYITKIPEDEVAYWIKQIVANHSTIRSIKFRMKASAPKSVIMQIIRATKGHPQPFVQSSRPDWNNGKERSSDPYEEKLFIQEHTAESFVEMCKQRLCARTEKRTCDFMWDVVDVLRSSEVPFLKAVGYCCHPQCWWYNGKCPELKSCHEGVRKLSDCIIKQYEEENGKEKSNNEN